MLEPVLVHVCGQVGLSAVYRAAQATADDQGLEVEVFEQCGKWRQEKVVVGCTDCPGDVLMAVARHQPFRWTVAAD